MKPWGCQVRSAHFSVLVFPRQQRRWLAGSRGGNEPLVAARTLRNLRTEADATRAVSGLCVHRCVPSWGALDYASCGAAVGHRWALTRSPASARSEGAGPVISIRTRRPFVTDSLREQSPVRWDSPSYE